MRERYREEGEDGEILSEWESMREKREKGRQTDKKTDKYIPR